MYELTVPKCLLDIFILLLCAVMILQASLDGSLDGSGGTSLLTPTCAPPDSPSYLLNTTSKEYTMLIHEGRCHLICLQSECYSDYVQKFDDNRSWPFANLRDTGNCRIVSMLHECTRGCRIYFDKLRDDTCIKDCEDECYVECKRKESCINPDSNDLWSQNRSCYLTCDYNSCFACFLGREASNNSSRIPPLPDFPVIYRQHNGTSDRGLVSVLLHETNIRESSSYTGFLFQIQDTLTRNVKYIWQNDPREALDLRGYLCRNVEVSLSLFNQFGHTSFTDPVALYIKGNEPEIPDAPEVINVSEELDRLLFQHVILNVTWKSPENDMYLNNFIVQLVPEMDCNLSSEVMQSQISYDNPTTIYSTTFRANQNSDHPLMGCAYYIEIFSVGKHGNTSSNTVQYTVRALKDYMDDILSHFICTKEIAVTSDGLSQLPYFVFNLSWTLTVYMDFVHEFILDFRINNTVKNQESNADEDSTSIPVNGMVSMLSTTYMPYSHPRRNIYELFLLQLKIIWNQEEIFTSAPEIKPYNCTLSAQSPAPSEVRNLTVWSAEALSRSKAAINASWIRPLHPNGVLASYIICLAQSPLQNNEPRSNTSYCISVSGNEDSFVAELSFISESEDDSIYFQIQPTNTYIAGNWSEGYPIPLPKETSKSAALAGAIISSLTFAAVVVVGVISAICCIRRTRFAGAFKLESNLFEMTGVKSTVRNVQGCLDSDLVDEWELSPAEITVEGDLGHGAFGIVKKGCIQGPLLNSKVKLQFRNASYIPVAIKFLNDHAIGSERSNFLSEIEVMKKISDGNNPHVVAMLGCITIQEPLCLLTEFVKFGDLLSYLRSKRNPQHMERAISPFTSLSPVDLLNFSYQIADGMDFLSSKGVIHRDLACRNILVDEGMVLKITDFGLSRETEKYMKLSKGHVPFKWMPIEFLELGEFTFASDVWSFGVVLWEVATLGEEPYPGVSNIELLSFLKSGGRLKKPENMPSDIYDIMKSCWNEEQSKRPNFSFLKEKFSGILLSQRSSNPYVLLGEYQSDTFPATGGEEFKVTKSSSMSELKVQKNLGNPRCISWNPGLQYAGLQQAEHGEFSSLSFFNKMSSECSIQWEETSKCEMNDYYPDEETTEQCNEIKSTKNFQNGAH